MCGGVTKNRSKLSTFISLFKDGNTEGFDCTLLTFRRQPTLSAVSEARA